MNALTAAALLFAIGFLPVFVGGMLRLEPDADSRKARWVLCVGLVLMMPLVFMLILALGGACAKPLS